MQQPGSTERIMLLDGGMGHLIKQWGVQLPDLPFEQQFLAGCLATEAAPETVLRAHAAYIEAGCHVITTNNFVSTQYSLAKIGRATDAAKLTMQAGCLARQAVQGSNKHVLVAGSLPPLQESYQTDTLPDPGNMQEQYLAIATALSPYVDVFLAETLSTLAEAHAALQAAAQAAPGKPAWVSFTLEDSTACCLRSKEPLPAAVQSLKQHPNVAAVLVNCCTPAAVTAAVPVLRQHLPPGVRVGCYANGFQTTTTQWLTGSDAGLIDTKPEDYDVDGIITPEAYLRHAQDWAASGADIIGGCCGIRPQHLKILAQQLALGANGVP